MSVINRYKIFLEVITPMLSHYLPRFIFVVGVIFAVNLLYVFIKHRTIVPKDILDTATFSLVLILAPLLYFFIVSLWAPCRPTKEAPD